MNFPKYEDFAKELNIEKKDIADDAIRNAKNASKSLSPKELAGITVSINAEFTLNLLQRYHNWLAEHFQEN